MLGRTRQDHDLGEARIDVCNCMEGHLEWMQNFGSYITCTSMIRNVRYKPEQVKWYLTFMPSLIQELATAEVGTYWPDALQNISIVRG